MLNTLVMLATLTSTPAQADNLALTNVRATHGPAGVVRKDSKLQPGDHLFLTFDIEGITTAPDGTVKYSTTTEILAKDGKVLFKEEPREMQVINALGGTTIPGYAHVDVGLTSPAGDYTIKVTVTDLATKRSQAASYPVQVAERSFGIVRLTTTADANGTAYTSLYQTGGSLWVNFGVVGFQRSGDKKQPQVAFELAVLDDMGKPTMSKPFQGEVSQDVPEKAELVPAQFFVALNRPGKFTVVVKATDKIGGKSAEVSFPITVMPAAK
jgi:hypothetical protein